MYRLIAATGLAVQVLVGPALAFDIQAEKVAISALTRDARYGEALDRARALGDRVKAERGANDPEYARALGWQAYLYQVQGRFAEADPLFHQSLALLERALPADHPDIATSINNLGFQYQVTDRLDEAEALYKRSLAMREKALPGSSLLVADSLNNLAQVYKAQGRLRDAEPLLRRALDLRTKQLPQNHPLIAQSLANLAGTIERQGRPAAAEPLLRRALAIRTAAQTTDHPEIAGITSKLAQNLSMQRRLVEAQAMFDSALAIRSRSQPPEHVDIASSLHDSALNLIALDRVGEAETALERALVIRRAALPGSHPDIARTYGDLARIAMAAGDRERALERLRAAIEVLLTRDRLDDIGRRQMTDFIEMAWELFGADKPADTIPIKIVDETLQVGQRAVSTPTAAAVSRMAARFATTDAGLQALIRDRESNDQELAILDRELTGLLAGTTRREASDKIRQRISEVEAENRRIDERLRREFPGYFSLVKPEPLTVETIRTLLDPDEALISYVATPDSMYVWAVSDQGVAWHKVDMTLDTITQKVTRLRDSLDLETLARDGTKARLFDLGIAHELHQALIAPVAKITTGKTHLAIVASGPVTSLPFNVLIASRPAKPRPALTELDAYRQADWLIRHHALSVLPSVNSLSALRRVAGQARAEKSLIGFGNPVFAAPSTGQETRAAKKTTTRAPIRTRGYASYWRGGAADLDALRRDLPPLPETETELKAIATKLGTDRSEVVLGRAATEGAVKASRLDQFRIVYFATHGLVAGEVRGLGEPALALTLPATPSEIDDGLLTASEVTQLRLDADWVVLSACNTASGDSPGAEALSGLARSFFHAGARAMLVSHWRVGSEAAARLTTATFARMQTAKTVGRAEALRQAMLEMTADTADPWSAYPGFWAPFTVVGEGRGG